MPLSSIVTIVLRLYALYWIVESLISLIWLVPKSFSDWRSGPSFSAYLVPVGMCVIGALIAMWSRTIGRAVTPKPQGTVELGSLSSYDLYCFAFTFLGLYFVLSSISPVINWCHFLVVEANHKPELDGEKLSNFYNLTDSLIRLLAGGACLLFAPRFARKLAHAQRKEANSAS